MTTVDRDDEERWVANLLDVLHKELKGDVLSAEEKKLLAAAGALELFSPGEIEQAVVRRAFAPLATTLATAQRLRAGGDAPEFRVAAASIERKTPLWDELRAAMARGSEWLEHKVGSQAVRLLRIDAVTGMVEPLYQEGYVFTVERRDGTQETVRPHGGVFLEVEDLRAMELVEDGRTIRLVAME